MNAPDDGEDATELGGGSIVIHKGDANSNTRSAIAGSGARIAGLAAVPTRGGGAEIAFTLSADANITATVLNVAGRRVRTIGANVAATRGANSVLWDGRNEHATRAPAGIYLIRLTSKTGEGRVNNSTTLLRIGR